MLMEFFLERSRIELAADGLSYRGHVPDLPEISVTAATSEQCKAKLAGAIAALLAFEARRGRLAEADPSLSAGGETRQQENGNGAGSDHESGRHIATEADHRSRFTDIIYQKQDWVARVTINRPSVYNAYTGHTLGEMANAFRDAASDDEIAVLVLTGEGDRAFCSGGDVRQHSDEHVGNPQAVREWMKTLINAHEALRQLGKPSIARINGLVAGGGNELALACDLAIAADHAKFVQVETTVGLLSNGCGPGWLPIVIGDRRARELVLTGEPISANKALLWGLVNDVVPYKELDKAVDALCNKLIDRFPDSTRYAREQLSFWKDLSWNATANTASEWIETHFSGEEAREGMAALAEKREVDYRSFRRSRGSRTSATDKTRSQ